MSFVIIIFTGVGLAMDAFAASIASGICCCCKDSKKTTLLAAKTGACFGFFQGLMPVLGFFLGTLLISYVSVIDHWIAFILLAIIGVKMIIDATKLDRPAVDYTSWKSLFFMSIATSIDAFAVGITLSVQKVNIYLASVIIAVITFSLSFIGLKLGNKLGEKYERIAMILGGLILIAIGIKILVEHIFFA